MEYKLTLPKLGESILSAIILKWYKKENDVVKLDEPLLEVTTDKVNSEIPSPVEGIIKKIIANVDDEILVGDLIAIIETETNQEEKPSLEKEKKQEKKEFYSPRVLKIAQEKNISFDDLKNIQGTGDNNRVTSKDVENYSKSKKNVIEDGNVEIIRISPIRKKIAENILQSVQNIPQASLITEVDVTDVFQVINEKKDVFFKEHKAKLSITSVVVKALSKAIEKYPLLNATFKDDSILVKKYVNVGIAVNVNDDLVVPVIKNIKDKSISEIAKDLSLLSSKARENKLSLEEISNGSITLSNFGMSKVTLGMPIIRYPEAAIIGIGAISKKIRCMENNSFKVRQIVNICLTFDHRIADGMYACSFLNSIKENLENLSLVEDL